MKILRLKFKNINSLRGEHEVDFTQPPLKDSGLFAITGPTGSGKSTLLDVITLALFSRVPRLGRVTKSFVGQSGALLTRNMQEASAVVEYQCHAGIFRSAWSISVNRNGNLRDYEMELVNLDEGRHLDLKRSEVPAKNEELIGLNYDQFVKSILLAQGEFAEFLKVNKSERGELLEKITGTGIYRELGRRAFEKKKEFAEELEKLRARRATFAEQLLGEEELKENHTRGGTLAKDISRLEKSSKEIEAQLVLRKELKDLSSKREGLSQALAGHTKKLQDYRKTNAERLEQHEKTAPFSARLEEWKNRQKALAEFKEEERQLKGQRETLGVQLGQIHSEVGTLLKKELKGEELLEGLETFRKEVVDLDQQRSKKGDEYHSYFKQLESSARQLGVKPNPKNPAADLEMLEERQKQETSELQRLREKLKDFNLKEPDTEAERLENRMESARKGQQWSADLAKVQKVHNSEEEQLTQLLAKVRELPGKLEKLRAGEKNARQEAESLRLTIENQKLRASLEEHRQHLVAGQPCPLCGSLEHPWAEVAPPEKDGLQKSLAEAEQSLDTLTREVGAAEKELEGTETREREIRKNLKKAEEELKELRQSLETNCGEWLGKGPVNWPGVVNDLKEKGLALKNFEKLRRELEELAVCLPLLKKMILVAKQGTEISAKRKELFEGDNVELVTGLLRDQWQTVQHKIQDVRETEKKMRVSVQNQQAAQTELEQKLSPELKEAGFEDIGQALEKRLSESEYLSLSRELNQLQQSVASAKAGMKTLEESIAVKKEQVSETETEDLQEDLAEGRKTLEVWQAELQELQRKWKNHQENLETISGLDEKIKAEEKTGRQWELLNSLIGDSTGKKFNDFAQELTLQQLLVLANRRLQSLSDRYLVDKPTELEDDSLIAVDSHMGGQRRSVKTLSGGETFVLSLSLALALSDLASKNISINSLFIDEGFGTLDPETLDTTLDTLERLQAESSKTIGIISHVEALKERIGTQIRLVRNGQGYSSIEVV